MTGQQDRFAADSVDAVASTLNQLIQTCRDGENGFASAATAVEEPSLRRLFQSYSQQRTEFAAELELEVRRLAQDPVQSGHASAALHRSWLDIKAGLVGRSDGLVIQECEQEEHHPATGRVMADLHISRRMGRPGTAQNARCHSPRSPRQYGRAQEREGPSPTSACQFTQSMRQVM